MTELKEEIGQMVKKLKESGLDYPSIYYRIGKYVCKKFGVNAK